MKWSKGRCWDKIYVKIIDFVVGYTALNFGCLLCNFECVILVLRNRWSTYCNPPSHFSELKCKRPRFCFKVKYWFFFAFNFTIFSQSPPAGSGPFWSCWQVWPSPVFRRFEKSGYPVPMPEKLCFEKLYFICITHPKK